jgi:hypothetical protein
MTDDDAAAYDIFMCVCHDLTAQARLRYLAATCGSMLGATALAVTSILEVACFSCGVKQHMAFENCAEERQMVCCGRSGSIEKSSTAESFRNGHLLHPCKPWFVSMKCLPSESEVHVSRGVQGYICPLEFFIFVYSVTLAIYILTTCLKDAKQWKTLL